MEEERKQRIYAEEVAAARLRREQQRAGGAYGSSNAAMLAASGSTASLRDERNKDVGRYSRPLHDQGGPRRQASEPAVPQHPNSSSSSPHTSSPGSSRPPSVAGHHGTIGRNSSRPPSVHAASSEDARQAQARNSSTGKRSSMASLPGKTSTFDRSSTYSMWSASNPTLLVPPLPSVPMYTMDMPLLPPAPPFMLHQYPQPRSQHSQSSSPARSSSSASPSRQRLPSSGSSDRVNVPQQPSSSRRGSNTSLSRPDKPTHQRQGSDDARRATLPAKVDRKPPPSSLRGQSGTSVSRGRPPLPSAASQPSPWTAPPLMTSYSQQQLSPAAIINGYGARPHAQQSRRQTTIS